MYPATIASTVKEPQTQERLMFHVMLLGCRTPVLRVSKCVLMYSTSLHLSVRVCARSSRMRSLCVDPRLQLQLRSLHEHPEADRQASRTGGCQRQSSGRAPVPALARYRRRWYTHARTHTRGCAQGSTTDLLYVDQWFSTCHSLFTLFLRLQSF